MVYAVNNFYEVVKVAVCMYYLCRHSRGFGLVGPLLGEDHPLNVSNALAGVVYYTVMMFLSKCVCVCVHACICLCVCVRTPMFVCAHMCMPVCVCACVCPSMHICSA